MAENYSSDGSYSSDEKEDEDFRCGVCEYVEHIVPCMNEYLKLHCDILIKDLVEAPACISCDDVNNLLNNLVKRDTIVQDPNAEPCDNCKKKFSPELINLFKEKSKQYNDILCETWVQCKMSQSSYIDLIACVICGQVFEDEEARDDHVIECSNQ